MDLQMKEKKHGRTKFWVCAFVIFFVQVIALNIKYDKVSPVALGCIFGLVMIFVCIVELFLWRSIQSWGNVRFIFAFVVLLVCVTTLCMKSNVGKYIPGSLLPTFYAIINIGDSDQKNIVMQFIIKDYAGTQGACETTLKQATKELVGTNEAVAAQIISSHCQSEKTENITNLDEWKPLMNAYALKISSSSEFMYLVFYSSYVDKNLKCETIINLQSKNFSGYKLECLSPRMN